MTIRRKVDLGTGLVHRGDHAGLIADFNDGVVQPIDDRRRRSGRRQERVPVADDQIVEAKLACTGNIRQLGHAALAGDQQGSQIT